MNFYFINPNKAFRTLGVVLMLAFSLIANAQVSLNCSSIKGSLPSIPNGAITVQVSGLKGKDATLAVDGPVKVTDQIIEQGKALTIDGLKAGKYTLALKQEGRITTTCSSTIQLVESALSINCELEAPTVLGEERGRIIVEISGLDGRTATLQVRGDGTSGINFQSISTDGSYKFRDLSAGNYRAELSIDQEEGSLETCSVNVPVEEEPAVDSDYIIDHVFGCEQLIGDETELGDEEYCFSWITTDDPAELIQHGQILDLSTVLIEGTYDILQIVTDQNGNVVETNTYTVTNLTVDVASNVVIPEGESSAIIEVYGVENTTGYSFAWDHDASNNSSSATVSTPGLYMVTVTTPDGCELVFESSVYQLITQEVSVCMSTCVDLSDNNSPQGEVSWSTGESSASITVCPENDEYITRLVNQNGTLIKKTIFYLIMVDDELEVEDAPIMFCGNGDNVIRFESLPEYTAIEWSDGSNGETLNADAPGEYSVTVTTTEGCELTKVIEVIEPSDCEQLGAWFEENDFYQTEIESYSAVMSLTSGSGATSTQKSLSSISINNLAELDITTVDGALVNFSEVMTEALAGYPYDCVVYITSDDDEYCASNGSQSNFDLAMESWNNEEEEAFKVWFHICTEDEPEDGGRMYFNYKNTDITEEFPADIDLAARNDCNWYGGAYTWLKEYNFDVANNLRTYNNLTMRKLYQNALDQSHNSQSKMVGLIGEVILKERLKQRALATTNYFGKPDLRLGHYIGTHQVDLIAYYHHWIVTFLGSTFADLGLEVYSYDMSLNPVDAEIEFLDYNEGDAEYIFRSAVMYEVKTIRPSLRPQNVEWNRDNIIKGSEQVKKRFDAYPSFTGGSNELMAQARLGVLFIGSVGSYVPVYNNYTAEIESAFNENLFSLEVSDVYGELRQGGFFAVENFYDEALARYEYIWAQLRALGPGQCD